MHISKLLKSGLCTSIVLLSLSALPASAEPHREDHHRGDVLDDRYHHGHYYPQQGFVAHELPHGFVTVHHPRGDFFFHGGVWYRHNGPNFVVVRPPGGLIVSVLPPVYTTVWVHGNPYYYANGVYFVQGPDGYVVSDPPDDADVSTEAPSAPSSTAENSFVYPKNGQSAEQQATDRYECHRWAQSQTGFDPTQPSGGVPAAEVEPKRTDYQRAMNACLEGRGYTVK